MIQLHRSILVFFLSIICYSLVAQNYYTIQIGTFHKAELDDFKAIKSYGHVYADIQLNNAKQIHVGGFISKRMADRALAKVKAKGFKDAFIKTHPMKEGREVKVVQVGTHTLGQKIPWARYLNMGRVHTILDGTKLKIVSGVFADQETATARLVEAKNRGFDDAFIKTLNSQRLHAVNAFETRGLSPMAKTEVVQATTAYVSAPYTMPTTPTYAYNDMTPRGVSIPNSYNTYAYSPPPPPRTYSVSQPIKSYMPSISYKSKNNATKWLQELLQQTGVYAAKITSTYNSQTAAAYEASKSKNYQLARFANQVDHKTYGDFRDWKDIQLLLNIANSLTPYGQRPSDEAIKEMFGKPETLDLNELQMIVSWDYRFRRGLKSWASEDMLRGEMARALKIAYLQSQLRLENFYKGKGYSTKQAQGLAFVTLKMLVGEQLDRFQ